MESYWFIITVSLCLIAIIKSTINALSTTTSERLPPGPLRVPIIGNLLWLRNSISDLESILRRLKARYGPLITLRIGPRPFIFVSSHSLAHFALVQNGTLFSDRPAPSLTSKLLNPSQKGISFAPYGATWRLFRRNLTHEILNPARVRSYSGSRHWVLTLLVNRILEREDDFVRLIDHFQFAMFSLLALMCFGDRLGEEQIKEIERVQRRLLLSFRKLNALNIWGKLGKILFRSQWKELVDLREDQKSVLLPLIRACIVAKQRREVEEDHLRHGDGNGLVVAYVDTLIDLQLPEEDNRKLEDWEMVNLCSEFLSAGTDTTSTALQWIMANLVKYPELQRKLYDEIVGVKGRPPVVSAGGSLPEVVEEEDLQKMPYLKAVVLEGLRRHPPGHFVLPHRVSRDVDVDGYVIPKNAIVNFMVADMGWDSKVWEQPMEFKPERFLDEGAGVFDVTGSKEIKMMPFGAGRRVCPASGLAMLHLEYFVANLIWYFEWTPRQGEEIDLTEKQEFTIVMKNPLCARISPRNCS